MRVIILYLLLCGSMLFCAAIVKAQQIEAVTLDLPYYNALIKMANSNNNYVQNSKFEKLFNKHLSNIDWTNQSFFIKDVALSDDSILLNIYAIAMFNESSKDYIYFFQDNKEWILQAYKEHDYTSSYWPVGVSSTNLMLTSIGGKIPAGFVLDKINKETNEVITLPLVFKIEDDMLVMESVNFEQVKDSTELFNKIYDNEKGFFGVLSLMTGEVAYYEQDEFFCADVRKVGNKLVTIVLIGPQDLIWNIYEDGKWSEKRMFVDDEYTQKLVPEGLPELYVDFPRTEVHLLSDGSALFHIYAQRTLGSESISFYGLVRQPLDGEPSLLNWEIKYYLVNPGNDDYKFALTSSWYPSNNGIIYMDKQMYSSPSFVVDRTSDAIIFIRGGIPWKLTID